MFTTEEVLAYKENNTTSAKGTENLFSTEDVLHFGKGSPTKRSADLTTGGGDPKSKSPRQSSAEQLKTEQVEQIADTDTEAQDDDSEFFMLTEQEKIPDYLCSDR